VEGAVGFDAGDAVAFSLLQHVFRVVAVAHVSKIESKIYIAQTIIAWR
jgi:hypothetical protein